MVKRLVWFLLGAGVALYLLAKVRGYLRRASPEAIGHRVADSAAGVRGSAQDFATRFRAAMAERETELRETLGRSD